MSIVITEIYPEEIKLGDNIRTSDQISFQKVSSIELVDGRYDIKFEKNIIGGRKSGINGTTLHQKDSVEYKETK